MKSLAAITTPQTARELLRSIDGYQGTSFTPAYGSHYMPLCVLSNFVQGNGKKLILRMNYGACLPSEQKCAGNISYRLIEFDLDDDGVSQIAGDASVGFTGEIWARTSRSQLELLRTSWQLATEAHKRTLSEHCFECMHSAR